MGRKERKQEKFDNAKTPEKAEKAGWKRGVKDAFCTECHEWYDTRSPSEVNRHAH